MKHLLLLTALILACLSGHGQTKVTKTKSKPSKPLPQGLTFEPISLA